MKIRVNFLKISGISKLQMSNLQTFLAENFFCKFSVSKLTVSL